MVKSLRLLLLSLTTAQAILLNIHLQLHSVKSSLELCPYTHALRANLFLKQAFPLTEDISFMKANSPHVTLFLADFDLKTDYNVTALLDAAQAAIQDHEPCEIQWPKAAVVHGAYAMYPIQATKCLRSLSSQLVRALQAYITRPPPTPDWIKTLPLLQKLQKLYLVKKFGSPNVFEAYDPHVTVGYDETSQPDERLAILEQAVADIHDGICGATLSTVAIAKVGVGGSVLQQGVLRRIELTSQEATDNAKPGIVWSKTKK